MIFLCATNHQVNTVWLLRFLQGLYARTHGNILYQRRHQQNTPHHPAERLDQKANRHTCFRQRDNLQLLFTSILLHSSIQNKMYLLIHFNYNTTVSLYFYAIHLYNKFHFFDHKILLTYTLLHKYITFQAFGSPLALQTTNLFDLYLRGPDDESVRVQTCSPL